MEESSSVIPSTQKNTGRRGRRPKNQKPESNAQSLQQTTELMIIIALTGTLNTSQIA
jgi:hypothetical protein